MADDNYEPEPLDIEHDTLLTEIIDRNREDTERASSAGESRAAIKDFLERTGMNSKAFSWCRAILKQKKYSSRMDIIRSLEEALPMVKAHVVGQDFGPDLVDRAQKPEPEPEPEPVDFADPEEPAPDYHQDAPATDEEADQFNAAVDAVSDDAGNVVRPFGVGKSA